MNELRELYQQLIVDHGRSPRNFKILDTANHQQNGYNPLCGDQITVYVQESNHCLTDISFQGCGCAISMASASLMTAFLKGKTIAETKKIFDQFQNLVKGSDADSEILGKLVVLAGVAEFPMRVKCATLAWHTLLSALKDEPIEAVSTEQDDE